MWARLAEMMLAIWLVLFPHATMEAGPSVVDLVLAALVFGAALLCFWPRFGRLHLITLATGSVLVALGFAGGADGSPRDQSRLVVGLLLLMFAIVPSRASRPPRPWRTPPGRVRSSKFGRRRMKNRRLACDLHVGKRSEVPCVWSLAVP